MPRFSDLTGRRFGRLVVVGLAERTRRHKIRYLCKCDCGELKSIDANGLRAGNNLSCGCLRTENRIRHGMHQHPLYNIWKGMRRRCTVDTDRAWDNYGGRGITVCPQWNEEDGINQFIKDMGERPLGYTLERIDNDGPYSPENCEWVTMSKQKQNTRRSRYIEHDGLRLTLSEWARRLGVSKGRTRRRFLLGQSIGDLVLSRAESSDSPADH
jgi:hypothetical protein